MNFSSFKNVTKKQFAYNSHKQDLTIKGWCVIKPNNLT